MIFLGRRKKLFFFEIISENTQRFLRKLCLNHRVAIKASTYRNTWGHFAKVEILSYRISSELCSGVAAQAPIFTDSWSKVLMISWSFRWIPAKSITSTLLVLQMHLQRAWYSSLRYRAGVSQFAIKSFFEMSTTTFFNWMWSLDNTERKAALNLIRRNIYITVQILGTKSEENMKSLGQNCHFYARFMLEIVAQCRFT